MASKVTPRELALRGGLGVQTIYNRLQRYRSGAPRPANFPRPVIIGGRIRFDAEECERWLAEGDGPLVAGDAESTGGEAA